MKIPLGAQVWSLRNQLNDNAGVVFNKLAAAGYTFIEPAGFNITEKTMQGFLLPELKRMAGYHGLEIISGHFHFGVEEAHAVCEAAVQMGMKYIVRSFFQNEVNPNTDYYKQAADALNHIGETAEIYGLQLAYHNHAHEFDAINGILPFDLLLQNTDPELVSFQADLGWMVYAGQLPQEYFKKHPGRFPLWHLRDIDADTKKSTAMGEGMVPFKSIFAEKEKAGLKYAMVEMSSDIENPLGKMLDSYTILNKQF
ncbi:sugar phosphate isomerase/epimerase family protein [Niabella aquatica]